MSTNEKPVPPKAKAEAKQQSAAQKRIEARAAIKAENKLRAAKEKRNKKIRIGASIAAGVAVVGLIVTVVVVSPDRATYSAGGSGTVIDGVETFQNTAEHVEGPVDYPQTPATGGPHASVWLDCGIYTQPVPAENAVHSMEHGAVWVNYDPEIITGEDLDALQFMMPRSHAILSPMAGLDTPIALSAWNTQLMVDSVSDERIQEFFEEYWMSADVPEPGALCSSGFAAPGRSA